MRPLVGRGEIMKALKNIFGKPREGNTNEVYSPQNKKLARRLARYLKDATLIAGAGASVFAPMAAGADEVKTGIPNDGYIDVAIMDFEDGSTLVKDGYDTSGLSKSIPAMIIRYLDDIEGFRIIEEARLETILNKYGFTLSDFKENPYMCLEKMEGVDGIITGTYSLFRDQYASDTLRIDSRYIDRQTKTVQETQTARGRPGQVEDIVEDLSDEIAHELWTRD
jgi:hypothetical protein